jgi:hypothetical protein
MRKLRHKTADLRRQEEDVAKAGVEALPDPESM